jgi:hypothetical protein
MASLDQIRQRYPSAKDLTDNELIAKLSEITETPYEQVAARFGFDQKTSRGFLGAANDYAIEAANAAAGLAKGVTDFVSPGNAAGQFIQENIIEPGEANQSVPATLAKRQLQRGLQSDEIMPQLGAVASYVGQNPLLAASQAVGSFGPIGGAMKGAQVASGLAGLGARGAARVGLGTSAGLSGAAAGGDAGSAAYELVMNTPWETVSRHPQAQALIDAGANQNQVYEELATRAARKASVVPAIIGAVSGATGAESALASGVKGFKGVAKKVGAETLGETFEEGTTQYAGQAAAQEYNPSINPMQGVVGAGALGGALGAMVATPVSIASMEKDLLSPTDKPKGLTSTTEPQGEPPRLGFNPLAGTPIVFPDGTVTLGSEQELLKRYGANQTTTALGLNQPYINGDLVNSPGGNVRTSVEPESMDLTVANPAETAARAKLARDPRAIELRDTFGVIPTPQSLQLYSEIQASGVPVDSDLLAPVWAYAGERHMTPKRLEKAQQMLDAAIIQARKGTTNVSTTTAPIPAAPTGLAAGSPIVQGSVGATGPSVAGNVQPSAGPVLTGTPTGQAQPVSTPSSQPAAPVIQGTVNGPQASKAKQAKAQGQTTATSGAPDTRGLGVEYAEDEDALEIAKLTGRDQSVWGDGGVASAIEGEMNGQRVDAVSLNEDDVAKVVEARFAKSKNAKRDAKILNAYLTAMQASAGVDKAAIQEAIGDKYGISAVAVRKIGNPSKLVEAGANLGFTASQVMDLFNFSDNTKAQHTLVGRLESQVEGLRKAYDQATTALRRQRIALLMSRLSERITKAKALSADKRDAAFTSGLTEAGVTSAEGESAGFGDDLNREWARVESSGQAAVAVTNYLSAIESTQDLIEKYEAQGEGEAAQAARDQMERLQAQLTAAMQSVKPETKPVTKAAPDVAEARKRWNDAGRDLTKLSVEDLQVLKGYTASINNKTLSDKIAAEISSRGATPEAANAVQVESPASVSVQPKAKAGQGVGAEVRRAEKPASQGEAKILTPQEQYEKVTAGFPVPAWADLPASQQGKLSDLARRDQLNLAAVNRFVAAQVTDESNIIDVESRVINETVKPQVAKLAAPQIDRLEKHYGVGRDTAEFLAKVKEDIVLYVNKGASAVAGAIRDVIKAMAEGVLAVSLIFNPNANLDRFEFNVQQVIEQTAEVRAEVPAEAAAKMSQLAKDVYSRVAPAAMESGKGFIVADKPNGMIHVFTSKGKVIVQDTALFGMDAGDVMTGQKITPAGKFTMKAQKWEDYAGGFTLDVWTSKGEFEGVAIHAAYLGVPSQNRLARLATPTAADNKISGGCINTAHDTFIEKIIPNLEALDGGMLVILPDAQETTASLFPAQTKTTKTPVQDTKTAGVDRTVTGKEEKMMFGKDKAKPVKKPYNAKELLADIKDFVRSDIPGRKLMVVNSVDDLLSSKDELVVAVGAALKLEGAYGVAVDGRAFLIADRISKGTGRAAFMHEVGAHLGLENLLPKALYDKLTAQVKAWAASEADTDEVTLAARAEMRLMNANTTAEDMDAERLAYFVEEAVLAGVDPTASGKESAPLVAWFRTLWAAFKVAIRKLGFKPESLTAQDIVDMAFGAARLELSGTFHGTAAAFRKFSHKYMSTGEGQQAFGWGSYVAQAPGVAKGYWSDDVDRKTKANALRTDAETVARANEWAKKNLGTDEPLTMAEINRQAQILRVGTPYWFFESARPEGSLMRVDIAVEDQDVLDWNAVLDKQPAVLKRLTDNLPESVRTELEDELNASLDEMTGEEIYRGLGVLEKRSGLISEQFDVDDYNSRLSKAGVKQLVSTYLDEKIGIPALKFLDQNSRGDATFAEAKLKQKQELLKEKERTLAQDTQRADYWEKQRDTAPAQYKAEANQTWLNAVATRTSSEYQVELLRQEIAQDEKRILKLQNPTRNIVIFNDKNIFRVGGAMAADRQRMRFGKNASDQGTIAKNISKLPKAAQQPVRNMLGAIGDVTGKGLDYLVFTSDLVNRAVSAGIPSAKKFVDLIGKSKAEARENEIAVEKIADMYALVPEKDRGTGDTSVNRFLFDSTRESKWGYGKYRDADMGARFDALSKESQAFVKAVFEHGSNVLAQKKKVVMDSTNSEYDAMIAIARANGDKEAESKLLNEKKATIKRFQTLFKIRDGMPYAPIKRNGSHVVIAKSQEYLDAEAANDTKKITELESNGDHYHVSFTDGKWEGRTLQQQLIDQGSFADVQIAERDTAVDEMFSGHSALRELTKMRSRVDEQAKDGDKSASKMLTLISQMYLEALAEGSARKSEMRRRGVEGEVDMIRSFAQQGRADANFMASVKYNPQVQDALQEMRTQSKTGDRARKSELFNELAKRYVQSMEYSPRPWLNKLTRMSSIYYLATSPAYYLQNLTQPWMMSVPAMAGQHDYTAASGALFKAYTELGGVMKSAKLLKQQFDFDKVPADVRDAIKELVNRGRIDIGLDTEIGEFKVEGDGYFAGKISAADKALRLAVQKVESINRLSTAMAAYRLELARTKGDKQAATDYADRILTETHGDYTSFNAPRAFNTSVGKVALQFRKFQLIQLAFYAKLIKDSLQGNDRKAALKTLTYSLSHTALLAGAMGLPGYAAIAWALGAAFGDDDEPYDLTAEIRKAIGDEAVANLVLKGAPTLAGMDISGKVGAGNMLSILPFSQADLSTTAGRAEALGTLVGGASLGMTSRMVDGLGLMLGGDWYRGMEQTMPKGVSDAMKAWRIANEGMTRRNGDIILPASEISTMDSLFQAIGISPVQQTVTYERQNTVKALTDTFQARTTELKNQYTKAVRNGDTAGMNAARESWVKLQAAKAKNGLPRKPLSDLLKAPADQRKRERETVGGIPYTKATKNLAKQYSEI